MADARNVHTDIPSVEKIAVSTVPPTRAASPSPASASVLCSCHPKRKEKARRRERKQRTVSGDGAEAHDDRDTEPALAHDLDEQRILELRLLHLLCARPAHVPERATHAQPDTSRAYVSDSDSDATRRRKG